MDYGGNYWLWKQVQIRIRPNLNLSWSHTAHNRSRDIPRNQFSSVAQSGSTVCNAMDCSMLGLPAHHQLPGIYSNSCPLSQWCHPTISSSVIPFSSHLQSFLASGSFQISQFFTLGGQSIGVSASASVLPMNIQDGSPLGLTDWISLQSKGLSRVTFPSFEVVCCSMSGSNCCFLTCLQVSQEAGEVV